MRFEAEARKLYEVISREAQLPPRAVMARRKLEYLEHRYRTLQGVEHRALELMKRPDYTDIHPALVPCSPKDKPLWDYIRNTVSSAPEAGAYGRQIPFLCVDKNTGGVLGAFRLMSDINQLGVRDKHIGWNKERKFGGGLNLLANMQTCIGVAPFGRLTGGKFMSAAATSEEIVSSYERRYRQPLAALVTTSLFGKSSQYNRMKEWQFLGYTAGRGTFQVSAEVRKHIKRIFNANKDSMSAQGWTTDRATQDCVQSVFGKAKLSLEGLSPRQPRGIYFAPLGPNAVPMLRGEANQRGGTLRPQDEIAAWWRDRWYHMRLAKFRDEVTAFDFSCYGLSAQIELCKCAGSIGSDAPVSHTGKGGASPTPALHLAPNG